MSVPTQSHGSRSGSGATRWVRFFAGLAVVALAAAGCGGSEDVEGEEADSEQPEASEPESAGTEAAAESAADVLGVDTLRWIVPFDPGGGTDTTTRQLQPILTEVLGMPIEIENIPGGSQAIGTNVALEEGKDCSTVFIQAVPHISLSWMLQDTEFTYDDINALANINEDAGVIRVRNDAPWETLQDLIDDAKSRPGEITFSTSGFSSANYLALVEIMNKTGAEFNIVNFDGGNPARLAVVSGEVDATHASVYNSLSVADDTRVLAVHTQENRWPELTDDAPTVGEALGIDIRPAPILVGVFAAAECKAEHPERFDLLERALEDAITSQAFFDLLSETEEQGKIGYKNGDEMDEFITDMNQGLVEAIEQIPELELVQSP